MFIFATSANAYYPKGLKIWKKTCLSCHGSPFRGAKMHVQDEWEEIRDSSKTPILTLHKDDKESYRYLQEKMSNKKRKHLFLFLIGNAKDSGAVPGCDSNYCGP